MGCAADALACPSLALDPVIFHPLIRPSATFSQWEKENPSTLLIHFPLPRGEDVTERQVRGDRAMTLGLRYVGVG